MSYIIAIDQGTTGTTAALIDSQTFTFIDKKNLEFPQIFPHPGYVEHNLDDIWNTVSSTIKSLLMSNNVDSKQIDCIGITNQRETVCAFDLKGRALANAIVWQDRRTSEFCKKLKKQERLIRSKTGLPIDPYFSATKMRWLLDNVENVKQAAKEGVLRFGTIDTYLLAKLTNNKSFFTEASNASRTLLMNLATAKWDNTLLKIFNINRSFLPEIKDSFANFGKTEGLEFLPDGIPITGILGDQQAALFGQAGIRKGSVKCTYGTGSFLVLNTGDKIYRSRAGLLSTVAFRHNNKNTYALEGSCYITGAAVQWLRDNLKIISTSPQIEALAQEIGDISEMENILFLPFFTGIGSPHWRPDAKGAIVGLTRDSHKGHIARACLDGIALSINDLLAAMMKDTAIKIKNLKVDGGASCNNLLMEIQASVAQIEIIRPKVIETTAYGAALAAGIGNKQLSFAQISALWQRDRSFSPSKKLIGFYVGKIKQWRGWIKKMFL